MDRLRTLIRERANNEARREFEFSSGSNGRFFGCRGFLHEEVGNCCGGGHGSGYDCGCGRFKSHAVWCTT